MLANLTRIVMSQYAAKIGKSIEDLKDLPLEDLDISDLESSDGGSDSSASDGPPKLPLLRKVPHTPVCQLHLRATVIFLQIILLLSAAFMY